MTKILIGLAAGSSDAAAFAAALQPFSSAELQFAVADDFARALPTAEVVVTQRLGEAELNSAPSLRWLASWAAGQDGLITETMRARMGAGSLVVTNASGVHGPNIAEQLLGMMLMFTRRLHFYLRAQVAGQWARPQGSRSGGADELGGKMLLIVGLGRIGEALAVRVKPFGVRVVGLKRDPGHRHDATVAVDEIAGIDRLDEFLRQADHVALVVPATDDTRHLIDARRLALMKPTAFLYNVGRGSAIDEQALVAALRQGQLAGAGLDVFETEPLAADSPLWTLENVILTPHVAGLTPHYFSRVAEQVADNLRRYQAGQPLQNRYRPERGY